MNEIRISLRNAGKIDPRSIDDYIAAGGYEALKKARVTDREALINTLEQGGKLRGRGGGVPNGQKLKAVQLGGSSCGYLTPDMLDTPVDLDSMRSVGAALGSGATLVIDDSHSIVDMLVKIADFFNHESCGKCTPCREGSYRVAQLIRKIDEGNGIEADMQMLRELDATMRMSCFCPLGQSVTTAILSAMTLFPENFAAKLRKEA